MSNREMKMPILKIWNAIAKGPSALASGVFTTETAAQDFILEQVGCDRSDYEDWCDGFSNVPAEGQTFEDFVTGRAEEEVTWRITAIELSVFPDVERYDEALNALDIPPNGDDYNALFALLQGGNYEAPTSSGR